MGTDRRQHLVQVNCTEPEVTLLKKLHTVWDESQHPRHPAGSEKGGEFAPKGAGFVSPNIDEQVDFNEAARRVHSDRTQLLRQAAAEIDSYYGVKTVNHVGVGAWSDGAEQSLVVQYVTGDTEAIKASMALKGLLAQQKAVVHFTNDAAGPDTMYRFETDTSMEETHRSLLASGVEFHTLVQRGRGVEVYVFSPGTEQEVANAVNQASQKLAGTGKKFWRGSGEVFGSWTSREEGAAAYERVLNEYDQKHYGGLGGRDHGWWGIRDRYAARFQAIQKEEGEVWQQEKRGRASTIEWLHSIAKWDESQHPRHPAGDEKGGEFAPKDDVEIAGIRAALLENPDRRNHGDTTKNAFFVLPDGSVKSWKDVWKEAKVPKGTTLFHSHMAPHSDVAIGDPTFSYGDIEAWLSSWAPRGVRRIGLLTSSGTYDILELPDKSYVLDRKIRPAILSNAKELLVPTYEERSSHDHRAMLRMWAESNRIVFHENLSWQAIEKHERDTFLNAIAKWNESQHPRGKTTAESNDGSFAPAQSIASESYAPNTILKAKGKPLWSAGLDILINGDAATTARFIQSMDRPKIGRFFVNFDTNTMFVWNGSEAHHGMFTEWARKNNVIPELGSGLPWKEALEQFNTNYPHLKEIGPEGYVRVKNGVLEYSTSDEFDDYQSALLGKLPLTLQKSWYGYRPVVKWNELQHPRGKTTPESRGGSFRPKEGTLPSTDPSYSRDAYMNADGVLVTSNVDDAIKALAAGQSVELRQPRQVTVLLDKLAAIAMAAHERGEKAPMYDLCKVTVRGTNLFCAGALDIERVQMPQLRGFALPGSEAEKLPLEPSGKVDATLLFIQSMIDKGYSVEHTEEGAAYLRASQKQLNGVKVAEMMNILRDRSLFLPAMVISADNYIIDGHHRWAGLVGLDAENNRLGDLKLPVTRIGINILQLLREANEFVEQVGIKRQSLHNVVKAWLNTIAKWNESQHPRGKTTPESTPGSFISVTDTPEFKAWFGNSKVVGKDGKPLVMYHHTYRDFDAFKPGGYDPTLSGPVIWATQEPNAPRATMAHQHWLAEMAGETRDFSNVGGGVATGIRTLPLYLSINNPKYVKQLVQISLFTQKDVDRLISAGHDGVIFKNKAGVIVEAVVFTPTQIKSAIGNRGTYDPNDPDITKMEWDESQHPRGKTTEKSTPGSFAPSGKTERKDYLDQEWRKGGGYIARGVIAAFPDGGVPIEVVQRMENGTATAKDLLPLLDLKSAGEFWYGLNSNTEGAGIEDAESFAQAEDGPGSNWWNSVVQQAIKENGPKGKVDFLQIGIVMVAKRPKGWTSEDNPDNGLMGNSYIDTEKWEGTDLVALRYQSAKGWVEVPVKRSITFAKQDVFLNSIAKWNESQHPRGKTTPESTPGSFTSSVSTAIRDFEASLVGQDVEVGQAFSQDGKPLLGARNRKLKSYKFTISGKEMDHLRAVGNVILTHNHPEGMPGGESLSHSDIGLAIALNAASVRAVHKDSVYVVERGEAGWPSANEFKRTYLKIVEKEPAPSWEDLSRVTRDQIERAIAKFPHNFKYRVEKLPVSKSDTFLNAIAKWNEAEHPRGKTTPESTPGSFASANKLANDITDSKWGDGEVRTVKYYGGQTEVIKNPTQAELNRWAGREIKSVRWAVDYASNNYMVWDAFEAMHSTIVDALGVETLGEYSVNSMDKNEYVATRLAIEDIRRLAQKALQEGDIDQSHLRDLETRLSRVSKQENPFLNAIAKWNEAEHPRGKTTPESTPGSFAPSDAPKQVDYKAKIAEAEARYKTLKDKLPNLNLQSATKYSTANNVSQMKEAITEIVEAYKELGQAKKDELLARYDSGEVLDNLVVGGYQVGEVSQQMFAEEDREAGRQLVSDLIDDGVQADMIKKIKTDFNYQEGDNTKFSVDLWMGVQDAYLDTIYTPDKWRRANAYGDEKLKAENPAAAKALDAYIGPAYDELNEYGRLGDTSLETVTEAYVNEQLPPEMSTEEFVQQYPGYVVGRGTELFYDDPEYKALRDKLVNEVKDQSHEALVTAIATAIARYKPEVIPLWIEDKRKEVKRSFADEFIQSTPEYYASIMSLLDSRPVTTQPVTVYRGVKTGTSMGWDYLESGDTISLGGFTSTTGKSTVAAGFGNKFLVIHIPKGSKGVLATTNDGESEILINHGTTLKVLGKPDDLFTFVEYLGDREP